MKLPDTIADAVSFDLETAGKLREFALQPWRVKSKDAWISTFSAMFVQDEAPSYAHAVFPSREQLRDVLIRALDERRPVLGWNINFDIAWLLAYGFEKEVFRLKWVDGMRLWRHMDIEPEYDANRAHKRSYRLKGPDGAVAKYAPALGAYDSGINYQAETREELEALLDYNDLDTLAAYISANRFWDTLEPSQRVAAWIEADMLPFAAQANLEGMRVDIDALYAARQHTNRIIEKSRQALEPHGVTAATLNTPVQLGRVLFGSWGLQPLKRTVTGIPSTDKETLHELAPFDDRVKIVRDWREAANLSSKFINTIDCATIYNPDGRVHPEAMIFGTYSGRLTYSSAQGKNKDKRQTGFALHQMKNHPMYRSMISAPEGFDMVEFDASGQEFRWMAVQSNDPTMLQLCLPGEDPHSFMGSQIDPDPTHDYEWVIDNKDGSAKLVRKGGKVANLSLQYRTSYKKLVKVARIQYDIPMTDPEGAHVRKVYLNTYKMVPIYWMRQIHRGQQLGYAETLAGRRVQVQGDWTRANPHKWAMESTMINYPIQGTGADQKYLAMSVLKSYVTANRIRFALDLHDGLYFYVPKDKSRDHARIMRAMLDNLPYQKAWGFKSPIPLTWDCKIGSSWGDLKELKD